MVYSEIVIDNQYSGFNPVILGRESCVSNHSYGPAVRTHWLLHFVISGFGHYTYKNQTYKVGPGQMFIIPPFEKTYYIADEKRPWDYVWIGFTTDISPHPFSSPVITCPEAEPIFLEMLTCDTLKNGRSAFLSGCIWKLTSLLLEKNNYTPNHIDEALHCIHSEYASGITIQEIADRLCLNRSYFFSIFKKYVGMSPSEYLIHVRLERAAEMLAVFGETPTVAATSVGYDNIYHFSKAFKKKYGVSPREYRKKQLY